MSNRPFPEVLPLLLPIANFREFPIADAGQFQSRIIDISDVVSDPSNPLPDFGEALNVSFTRAWVLAWSVRLDLVAAAWAGTNRTNLLLRIEKYVAGQADSDFSDDQIRLFIPVALGGVSRYTYTGYRILQSKQARVQIRNLTGDAVTLDLDIWAKAWV